MSEPESRYRRQKRIEQQKDAHEQRVLRLSKDPVEAFELAVEEIKPKCVTNEFPSPWTDWSSGDDRETSESERPSAEDARLLCDGCPVADLCLPWALASRKSHGVYSGVAVENGVWDYGTIRSNREES